MEKYKDLLKAKSKSLQVFLDAKKKLQMVSSRIAAEISTSQHTIEDHKAMIKSEEDAIKYLTEEHSKLNQTIANIEAIVPGV